MEFEPILTWDTGITIRTLQLSELAPTFFEFLGAFHDWLMCIHIGKGYLCGPQIQMLVPSRSTLTGTPKNHVTILLVIH